MTKIKAYGKKKNKCMARFDIPCHIPAKVYRTIYFIKNEQDFGYVCSLDNDNLQHLFGNYENLKESDWVKCDRFPDYENYWAYKSSRPRLYWQPTEEMPTLAHYIRKLWGSYTNQIRTEYKRGAKVNYGL